MNRRTFLLAGAAFAAASVSALAATGGAKPLVTVGKDPSCGCCGAWAEHMRAAGYPVRVVEVADMAAAKLARGVPEDLWSCHTAEVAGYTIEGHVPPAEIDRLLAERPQARGLAVAGMPAGSPGMGSGDEPYEVVRFGGGAPVTVARYRGAARL